MSEVPDNAITKDIDCFREYKMKKKYGGNLFVFTCRFFRRDGNIFSIFGGIVLTLGVSDYLMSINSYPEHYIDICITILFSISGILLCVLGGKHSPLYGYYYNNVKNNLSKEEQRIKSYSNGDYWIENIIYYANEFLVDKSYKRLIGEFFALFIASVLTAVVAIMMIYNKECLIWICSVIHEIINKFI